MACSALMTVRTVTTGEHSRRTFSAKENEMPGYVAPKTPTTLAEMQALLANQGQAPGFMGQYMSYINSLNNPAGGGSAGAAGGSAFPTFKLPTPDTRWNAATDYAKNPFQNQTVPPYSPPPSLGADFGFGPLVQGQLQNGATLPGMSGTMPNGYVSQASQRVAPNAFMNMQANPFASTYQQIAGGGGNNLMPMLQGLLGQPPAAQAPAPAAPAPAAPAPAAAA